ncbi:peptidoglycan editing factor PgeF [Campylobacter porcelli]|uniref:Purine nucleoside phosphorylase n=1 Tax=Campylobacter porcelli TaxID=1660073 RepID=A0ABU7M337_9BACT|nr:peptidoglycan editing factor PgeF [Campylobacter sp. CX2-4855-23]
MLVSIDDDKIIAGFTTKFGGVSNGVYESLNLAYHVGDSSQNVRQNRDILASKIGAKNLIFMEQIHSDFVMEYSGLNLPPCDAIFTHLKGVGICVMVADCAAVLLYDKKLGVVAAIHAGRAGVVSKIVSKTIDKMGSNPKNIKAIVGPNIKKNCYEIGDLDLGEFNKFKDNAKFDINGALRAELNTLGVVDYEFSDICNHCNERFYSYRRDKITGRFAGFIMLKG